MRYRIPIIVLAALICAVDCPEAGAAPKTDVIIMKNGDRITGEIKSLLRSQLELSTDYMGTILIEWIEVEQVVSHTGQAIELDNGTRFFGTLEKPENEDMVRIDTAEGVVGVNSLDIVSMYPVEAGFWDRLDLSVKFGFSWDKSSGVGKYNIGVNGAYRDPRFITQANFSSDITTQQGDDDTTRTVASLNHMRFLQNKRFRAFFGNVEKNDELGINLRALVGAGYGWIPVRDQSRLFGLMAGLSVNREIPTEGEQETNIEAVGTLMFDYYMYSFPERRLSVNASVYPSLTDTGRYRATLDTTLHIEIIHDLFWDLSAYGSYDSRPLSQDASSSDYGINSSLGYKF